MASKTEKLCSFYSQCIEKGYTDMSDDTQALKAKVIATDIGLRYGRIAALFEEAKNTFETEEARKKAEEEKAAAEAARTSVPGELVLTLREESDGTKKSMDVFRRPDGSVYCTHEGGTVKFEGAPDLEVRKGGVLTYTYHPSKTVFTGASSGGIAMGGFHQTEAYSTEKVSQSGKGDIRARSGDMEIWVKYVDFSDATDKAFRRDDTYNRLSCGKRIICIDTKGASLSRGIMDMAVQNRAGYQDFMSKASMAVEMMRLPMSEVQYIAGFLSDVIAGNYPETDEGYYTMALTLSGSSDSEDLHKAVQIFKKISDYKDSASRAAVVQKVYEEVLQGEKERKILEKERKEKNLKRGLMIAVPLLAAAVTAGVIVSGKAKKNAAYNGAVQFMEAEMYDVAIEAFSAMDGYKDSGELITECQYRKAMSVINCLDLEDPDQIAAAAQLPAPPVQDENLKRIGAFNDFFYQAMYKDAYKELEDLGDYKDCKEVLEHLDSQKKAIDLMYRSFREAEPFVKTLPEDDLLKKSLEETISKYEPCTGTFCWMNSKNMEFESDFRLANPDYIRVMWNDPYVQVTMNDGSAIPFPSVNLDGKNYGLFNDLAVNGMQAAGNIQDLLDIKVNFQDGYITADMYYETSDGKKLGDSFYACTDDQQAREAAEKYYAKQKETVYMYQAEQNIKGYRYGKAKEYLELLPDSSKKQSMLEEIGPYLPYLGFWELVSGEATLLNDEKNKKEEFRTIHTDTSKEKYGFYIVVNNDSDLKVKQFKDKDGQYASETFRDKDAASIQYFLSVSGAGNLVVTEVKNGRRSTAEYKRTE